MSPRFSIPLATRSTQCFFPAGEDVLITGAGPIGIMAAAVVRHAGARFVVITDVNPYRLELARKMGVTLAINLGETSLADAKQLGMTEADSMSVSRCQAIRMLSAACLRICATARRSRCSASRGEMAIDCNPFTRGQPSNIQWTLKPLLPIQRPLFPDWPLSMASKPCWNSLKCSRCVITGRISSPLSSMTVILYQVSYISLP